MENETPWVFEKDERFQLNANSPLPLYHQMEEIILERIASPEMINRRMPPEYDLEVIFGVSRATIKKAMDDLVNKGVLARRRGVGTHVIKTQIIEDLARLKSYTEEMSAQGQTIRTQVLGAEVIEPDETLSERLDLEPDEQVLQVRRLRGTNKLFPVVLLSSYFPSRLGIDQGEDFAQSIYQMIEQKYKLPITWAEETIEAGQATSEEADQLEIEAGDTVLIMERVTFCQEERPIELVRGVYRPDRYKFSIKLMR